MTGNGMIFWDFDYTLGFRGAEAKDEERHPWGHCLLEILDIEEPGHRANLETIRGHFHNGFPWHRPEEPHPQLSQSDAWWKNVEPMFCRAFEEAGVSKDRALELAERFRHHFADVSAWSLYPETIAVLQELRNVGWRHAIVSNHIPELEQILCGLGLDKFIEPVVCSAATGYEKPHPEAFRTALRVSGDPERVWMVGDNPIADVQGAEAVGIPAIQVRMRRGGNVRRYSRDLLGVIEILSPEAR